jgi:hypothetical protein
MLMKRNVRGQKILKPASIAVLFFSAATSTAADFAIDPSNPNNGLFDIYSTTFDPPLTPGGDPFFGGTPPATREITITPTPTGVLALADTSLCVQDFDPAVPAPPIVPPCTKLYSTAKPSALNLTLSAGNTRLAINGGNVYLPSLVINISGSTDVVAVGASTINFAPSPGTVPVNGSGVAVFEIDIAPSTAVDFATFTEIVTSCTGPLCALIPILTLDMIRYRLTIDWDPSFTSFTADFIGQTANNSMVFMNLDSVVPVPAITVTDSVTPADDLRVPFADIQTGTSADETVTVTNAGDADLNIGLVTQPDPPFSFMPDMCSNRTLAKNENCALTIRFEPDTPDLFNTSFDIPSNDPDKNPVTITVSGTSEQGPLPAISVTDSVPPVNDHFIPFGSVIETMSADETVTVTNIGAADLLINQITVEDPQEPFSVENDSCSMQPVTPNDLCTFTIRFAPVATGTFDGSIDIASNDPNASIVTVAVDGTGVPSPAPDITVTDPIEPLDDLMMPFGNVTEATAWDQAVTITNDGNGNLTMGMIAQTDPLQNSFSILSDTCSAQIIAPAASCAVEVRFLPARIDTFSDSFDIPSDDPDEPTLTFRVSGSGVAVGTGTIPLQPDGADSGLFGSAIRPLTLLALLGLIAASLRRRYY